MKDDYEGAEILLGTTNPSADGANEDRVQAVFGASGDQGRVTASVEWYTRDPIFDGDRDYSAVQINGPSFGDTVGVSVGGNTGFVLGFPSNPFPIGDCPEDLYAGVLENPFGIPGQGCGYGYADISAQTGGLDRFSTFLDASYDINEDTTVYMESRYSRIESFGRYAPAVGFFFVDEGQRLANGLDPILTGDLLTAGDTDGSGAIEPGEGASHSTALWATVPDDVTDRHEFTFCYLEGTLNDGEISYDVYTDPTSIWPMRLRYLCAPAGFEISPPLAPTMSSIQQRPQTLRRCYRAQRTSSGT